ncbi:YkgJ family cysteine cluster protein [Desulfoluna sp.]|uniref:YkgJ family cysteine cluster protein n=1 Tax=Desulfoluna sp. TaxID=2045199 RepID=UPI00261AB8CE|nr:YkgJ family cysteine cluster protein [Desulfoluna sp.]
MDFTHSFSRYEALVGQVGQIFTQVSSEFKDEVACKPGCDDCCHALFDLTFVEALYLKSKFDELFTGKVRYEITERASKADRTLAKLKKEAYKRHEAGEDDSAIIDSISKLRVRCPLLGEEGRCLMYEYRPIACRVYGIPTSAAGKGHTCGLSGFNEGKAYPTLNMDLVYNRLYAISKELVRHIDSRFTKMETLLMPLSMVLITDFNNEFLGVEVTE